MKITFRLFLAALAVSLGFTSAKAEGIVAKVISAPVAPNGLVRDIRTGLNIYLQSPDSPGDFFLDPKITGYGIPAGGRMEVELVSGFQRDPSIPLDDRAILLVVGTPQQGLPAGLSGFSIKEGGNQNTFAIIPNDPVGLPPEGLSSPTRGATLDPIPQRGIKILHVGRVSAFVSRGEVGVVEVRIKDSNGNVIASGRGEVNFLPEPLPQVFPTNIPHGQRNHNWQRIKTGAVLGVAENTLPLAVILYERNEGLNNKGIEGAGVVSVQQIEQAGLKMPEQLALYTGGLIFRDKDGDGIINLRRDEVIGGFTMDAPEGAKGQQLVTPIVGGKPFLSVHTSRFNERAGKNIGGAVMQAAFIAGDKPGLYRVGFSLLEKPGDFSTARKPDFQYTVVVE